MLRLNSRLIPGMAILVAILTVLDSYPGWRLLLVALGGAWLVSYLWARKLQGSLTLKREIRFGWAQVGDVLEERFTLTNRSSVPCLWVEVSDHSDLPGHNPSLATGSGGNSTIQWISRGVCERRGLFTLGPTTWKTGDPLRMYSVEFTDPRNVQLMVTPPVVPLPDIQVAPGGRSGEAHPKPNTPEPTPSASNVREYQPGDSLRWIHWRTSARKAKLYIRQFDSLPAGDWWILLDNNLSVQCGEEPDSTLEHGVILAASLANQGLKDGNAVGLVAHHRSLAWLPPREGEGQRWEIMRQLALLKPGSVELSRLLANIQPNLGRDTSLIVVTADISEHWLPSLLPLIWQGAVPTVILLDPGAFGGTGQAKPVHDQLKHWGISAYILTPQWLRGLETSPGRQGKMEWRVTPRGRAILTTPSQQLAWREFR